MRSLKLLGFTSAESNNALRRSVNPLKPRFNRGEGGLKVSLAGILFLSLVLLGFFLRFYQLGQYPNGLYSDEVAIGYEAYSILKTGKDEYGTPYPLFFRSYDDYKLPIYIYVTTISESLFGKNEFAVRFPSAFFGSLTVLSFFALLTFLTGNLFLATLGGILLATSPWHIHFSRAAFESNVSLFLIVTGSVLILRGLRKTSCEFIIGLFFYCFALYTYHSPRIFIPLFSFALFSIFRKELLFYFHQRTRAIVIASLLIFILLIPFLQYSVSSGGLIRARSESFLRDVKFTASVPPYEKAFQIGNRFLENYFSYFSLEFLFFHGDYNGRHSVREIGMLSLWQLPFLLYGIYHSIKAKSETNRLFFLWLLITPLAAALASPNPHALRSIMMVIPLLYFTSYGVSQFFQKHRGVILQIGISVFLFYFFYQYLHIYYFHYPKRSGPDWAEGYRETAKYILENQSKYDKVVMTSTFGKGYMYLFFYGNFDQKVIQTYETLNESFDKYLFVHNSYTNTTGQKILYVARSIEEPRGVLLQTIRNSGNDVVFTIWEI